MALFLAGQSFVIPESPYETHQLEMNLAGMVLSLIGTLAGAWLASKWLPHTPMGGWLILKPKATTEAASHASGVTVKTHTLLGAIGEAVTDLRPAGKARFGDEVVDVQTRRDFLAVGDPVVVIEAQGNRILVRRLEP